MRTYSELFLTPEFQKQFDCQIINHINIEFGKIGANLPEPKFRDNRLIYDDPRINKLVERYRAGAAIVLKMMDQNEEKAMKSKVKASN